MSFDISLDKEPIESFGVQVLVGRIKMEGVEECFHSPVSYWGREEYLQSWYSSLCRGINDRRHSVLVTSMLDPNKSNFLMVWVLYYVGESVCIQNSVVFLDEMVASFNIDDVNTYVGEREIYNEDGVEISEWIVPISEVLSCKDRLKKQVEI
ncbi:hypothetical protein DJ564_08640 [Pseudomonas sp. 31-12]|uniref:hypothetical protein n=1 Tax=Pseudomonas sp. 31-12 TaxID=2201356 RepID=UPI000D6D4C2E|nr:hypothetical protein [Pseudomonas sp. 31-12]AWM90887.1 hypothetical protein DJ564_08640 [Pseudomonas sp. 31-12]